MKQIIREGDFFQNDSAEIIELEIQEEEKPEDKKSQRKGKHDNIQII